MFTSGYDLRYETGPGRCAWCWRPLAETDCHAVVSGLCPPHLHLRFHHKCWAIYRGLSSVEGREARALYRQWSPPRLEALRLHAGLTLLELAAKLGLSRETLVRYLSGEGKLGPKPLARLRGLAVDTRFERQEDTAGLIDLSDRRACFSLCISLKWNAGELAQRVGVRDNTVTSWWDKGVPKQSVHAWARLSTLARQNGFDAGMLVDDYLWTPELVRRALERSGQTQAAFAAAAGCHTALIRDAMQGRRRINRQTAYYLTRAALRLHLPLPAKGWIEPKRRAPRPFPGGYKGPQGSRVWRPEELALLGTLPDKDVAAQLGTRSSVAVMRMRRALKIPRVPQRGWDGVSRPAPVPLVEVCRRYYRRLGMEPPG
jgi:transcriptional regulator with XRE-family HTH domain